MSCVRVWSVFPPSTTLYCFVVVAQTVQVACIQVSRAHYRGIEVYGHNFIHPVLLRIVVLKSCDRGCFSSLDVGHYEYRLWEWIISSFASAPPSVFSQGRHSVRRYILNDTTFCTAWSPYLHRSELKYCITIQFTGVLLPVTYTTPVSDEPVLLYSYSCTVHSTPPEKQGGHASHLITCAVMPGHCGMHGIPCLPSGYCSHSPVFPGNRSFTVMLTRFRGCRLSDRGYRLDYTIL